MVPHARCGVVPAALATGSLRTSRYPDVDGLDDVLPRGGAGAVDVVRLDHRRVRLRFPANFDEAVIRVPFHETSPSFMRDS